MLLAMGFCDVGEKGKQDLGGLKGRGGRWKKSVILLPKKRKAGHEHESDDFPPS